MSITRGVKATLLICLGCVSPCILQALTATDGRVTFDSRHFVSTAQRIIAPIQERIQPDHTPGSSAHAHAETAYTGQTVLGQDSPPQLSAADNLPPRLPASQRSATSHRPKKIERRMPMELSAIGQTEPIPRAESTMSDRVRIDSNIVLARATEPRVEILAVTELAATDVVKTIWPANGRSTIELTQRNLIRISGRRSVNDKAVQIKIGSAPVVGPVYDSDDDKKWSYVVPGQIAPGTKVAVSLDGTTGPPIEIELVPPNSDVVDQPVTVGYSNNVLAKVLPLPNNNTIRVFHRFVRLSGERIRGGHELEFPVFDDENRFVAFARSTVITDPGGKWNADLELPLVGRQPHRGDTGKILVRAKNSDGAYAYANEQVKFSVDDVVNSIEAPPEITGIFQADATTALQSNVANDSSILRWNQNKLVVKGSVTGATSGAQTIDTADIQLVFYRDNREIALEQITVEQNGNWTATLHNLTSGRFELTAATSLGNKLVSSKKSTPQKIEIQTTPPEVQRADSIDSLAQIKVTFNRRIKVPAGEGSEMTVLKSAFQLVDSAKNTKTLNTVAPDDTSLILTFANVHPEVYTLTIDGSKIEDLFGNRMVGKFEQQFFKPFGDEGPISSPGITGATGPFVPYSEYLEPAPIVDGFNPSDHVETRVARLYYYRDAHRVAQIINRHVKSYNRAAVDKQQQLSDKARTVADQATADRQTKERSAIEAARTTREAEQELQQAQQQAVSAATQAAQANDERRRIDSLLRNPPESPTPEQTTQLQARLDELSGAIAKLESVATSARNQADAAFQRVQSLRDKESQATEVWQQSIAVEDRAREEQFRREVAAAQADPDTYAPGKPKSIDPVERVSISVIGEGLIQLRGPIKGINTIRTMINQIDTPVGQVRVGVHTVQINGEKGDRMEKVAGKIQRFIDHSRFLTLQSAEMLRKSIVAVAAQKAADLGGMPGLTQAQRDQKYLYAFFGDDFIRELEVIESEFLHTGNKLLSIHSMDSTSLASAMFLMALAKNSTRLQILQTFQEMMATQLTAAERNYFEAGLTSDGQHQLYSKHCKRNDFEFLSYNARFQSIRGMFDACAGDDDTMTPLQREFIRLAQILKSRLVVEMELKQRIMERAVIEERLGDRKKELLEARAKEKAANEKLTEARRSLVEAQKVALAVINDVIAYSRIANDSARSAAKNAASYKGLKEQLEPLKTSLNRNVDLFVRDTLMTPLDEQRRKELDEFYTKQKSEFEKTQQSQADSFMRGAAIRKLVTDITRKQWSLRNPDAEGMPEGYLGVQQELVLNGTFDSATRDEDEFKVFIDESNQLTIVPPDFFVRDLSNIKTWGARLSEELNKFKYVPQYANQLEVADRILAGLKLDASPAETLDQLILSAKMFENFEAVARHLADEMLPAILEDLEQVYESTRGEADTLEQAQRLWSLVLGQFAIGRQTAEFSKRLLDADKAFRSVIGSKVEHDFALREADASRRPLDHKKFLDMLVDEMEGKYIELLEGTRAHTANIDGYIKRLMTALDDDFNTQFYYPTFRKVRTASQLWDVQMGQVETTNVLANNRSFAKVTPEATMEFDLPKRDILINEAINGAKSTIQDIGALAADPTFLSLARLNSGQPTSSQFGGASGGLSTVRNVLPGISTDSAEAVLGQQGPGGSQFGAALESLIPEPAIYKFETGTGWEIRPVLQPDGQALVFDFNYLHTTNVREPVRADEKHLGRVKRHFVKTDVQLSNFELREISRYTVALKASRTAQGVPLLQDIPGLGTIFRPLPSAESSLQQSLILGQATIFPTLFDLMGLRWAPAVADLDPLRLQNEEFVVRNRKRALMNRVFDHSSSKVDEFLRIPPGERRMDLYRSQETMPAQHPNGYIGPGANLHESQLQEGYNPEERPQSQFIPGASKEGSPLRRPRPLGGTTSIPGDGYAYVGNSHSYVDNNSTYLPPGGVVVEGGGNYFEYSDGVVVEGSGVLEGNRGYISNGRSYMGNGQGQVMSPDPTIMQYSPATSAESRLREGPLNGKSLAPAITPIRPQAPANYRGSAGAEQVDTPKPAPRSGFSFPWFRRQR